MRGHTQCGHADSDTIDTYNAGLHDANGHIRDVFLQQQY